MGLTLALVDAPGLLHGGAKLEECNQKRQALLKAGFEFAFKVQQFANITDDEATKLFELLFAVIEKLHQAQKEKFRSSQSNVLQAVPEDTVGTAAATTS